MKELGTESYRIDGEFVWMVTGFCGLEVQVKCVTVFAVVIVVPGRNARDTVALRDVYGYQRA